MVPVNVAAWPSKIGAADRPVISGGRLTTVTAVLAAWLTPPSASAAVTVTVYVSVADPVGLASGNWCDALNVRPTGSTATACGADPSPQFTVAVSRSSGPGSVPVPVSVPAPPRPTVVALRFRPVTAGGALDTVTVAAPAGCGAAVNRIDRPSATVGVVNAS